MAKKITLKNKNGDVLCPHTAIEQVQGLKEALDGKLPLSGGTLTGSITAPTYKGATDKSGVYSEAIMSYTSAFANNDLNSERFLKAGMYRLDAVNDTINQPGGRGYGHLMTIRGGNSDTAAQMFFDYFDNGNAYIRTGSTNPNAGDFYILNRAWKQLLEDQVTTSHIAEKSINGSKIVSNVDLTGTPMMGVEPTLSSPDRTIASVGLVKEAVDGIEIGGTNLVVNSSTPRTSTAYFIGNLPLYENLIENSVYTITIWGELGADRTSFYLYPEWGMGGALCELQQVSNGVYNATFIYHKGNATNSNAVGLYQMPSTSTSTSTIERIKIEKGNKATDWSPAPEDVVNGIKIDTRNLLLDSKEITVDGNATTVATSMVRKDMPISIKAGDVFTFNCEELILNTESTVEQHRVIIYESGVSQVSQPAYISPTSRTATLVADRDCAKPVFLLYARDINMSQGNSITYKGATLVKGTKPMLLWQPSVEEVQTKIDAKLPLSGGTLTGDLIAPSFKTNLTSGAAEAVMAYPINYAWGTDLNSDTYLKPGMYQMSSASSPANQPDGLTYGALVTMQGFNPGGVPTIGQIYFNQNTNGIAYIRTGTSSNILTRGWKQLVTADDSGNITAPAFETTSYSGQPTRKSKLSSAGLQIYGSTNSGWAGGVTVNDSQGVSLGTIAGAYGGSSYSPAYYFYGGEYNNPLLKLLPDGRATFKNTVIAPTFDGMATSVKDGSISTSKIADTAITSTKLAQSLILRGTPQLETQPTPSSESQNIASVGLVKKAVDGIEIGGVNLILNSDFSSGTEHWSKLNHGSLSAIEGVATFTLEAVAKGQGMVQTSPVNIVSGQQYTVSFDVRSEDIQTLNYCFLMGVGVGNVSLSWLLSEDVITPEWQRIERTFTATTTGTYMFGFGVQGLAGTEGVIEFQFKKLKIEKGNKATDWSPAPEDVEAKIEAAKPIIFLQTLQPSATEVKEGDIWIIQ